MYNLAVVREREKINVEMRRILCEDEQIARLANAEVSRLEKANLAGQPIWPDEKS